MELDNTLTKFFFHLVLLSWLTEKQYAEQNVNNNANFAGLL